MVIEGTSVISMHGVAVLNLKDVSGRWNGSFDVVNVGTLSVPTVIVTEVIGQSDVSAVQITLPTVSSLR